MGVKWIKIVKVNRFKMSTEIDKNERKTSYDMEKIAKKTYCNKIYNESNIEYRIECIFRIFFYFSLEICFILYVIRLSRKLWRTFSITSNQCERMILMELQCRHVDCLRYSCYHGKQSKRCLNVCVSILWHIYNR